MTDGQDQATSLNGSQDQAQDSISRTDENEAQNQEEEKQLQAVLASEPIKAEVAKMSSEADIKLANAILAAKGDVSPDTLSQIMALLGQTKPPPSLPPPQPTSPIATVQVQTPAPAPTLTTVAGLGQQYPGKAVVAPFGRTTRDFQCNTTPLANNRWGGPPREASPATETTLPTPQLSTPGQALLQAYAVDPDNASDGGWTPHNMIRSWVRDVENPTPPSRSPPLSPPSLIRSAHTPAREATLDVVDDDSDADTDLPTPGKVDQTSPRSPVEDDARSPIPIPAVLAPASSTHRTEYRGNYDSTDGGEGRRRPRVNKSDWERSGVKYKRDPHPAFSPIFLSKRILITFPASVPVLAAKPAIYEHFGKYGPIRMVWFHNQNGRECQEYILVFDYEESVESCLADPSRTELYLQNSEEGYDYIKVEVELAPRYLTTKTIFVKITGPRHDARSRSASPRRGDRTESPGSRYEKDLSSTFRSLPPRIYIDSVPSKRRWDDRVDWWARIREPNVSFESINRKAQVETEGMKAFFIDSMELGRRVPDKEIIPTLCAYFAEIVEVVPPIEHDGGWLIGVGGAVDAHNVMGELHKIPGITARWANEADGPLRRPDAVESKVDTTKAVQNEEAASSSDTDLPGQGADSCPGRSVVVPTHIIGGVEIETKDRSQRPEIDYQAIPLPIPGPPALPHPTLENYSPTPSTHSETETLPSQPIQTQPSYRPDIIDPRYPHLRKCVIPTYRGRTLREDLSEDTPRYFDDAAVFAGRLVKELETEQSLYHRFSRYGQICGIEYNPRIVTTTYATARILYSQRAAAERALKYEQGAISFGSMLKIDRRRVLANDVQLEEKYIDDWGRAYSPSMVSQYSPPQQPIEDEMLFTQPPPLNTGPAMMGVPPLMQWMPYPLPPLPTASLPPTSPEQAHAQGLYQSQAMPMSQNGDSASHGVQSPPPSLLPMIYAMGLGYHPPPGYSLPPPPNIPENGILPTQPITSFVGIFPSFGGSNLPIPFTPIPQAQNSDMTPIPQHQIDSTTLTEPMDPSRKRSPKVTGTKMENGVLKIIYDDEDMKRYRRENGMPDSESDAQGQVKAEIAPSDISLASLNLESIPGGSEIPDEQKEENQQKLHDLPIPFTPPRATYQGMGIDPARFSPEILFRPFNPPQFPPHSQSQGQPSGNGSGYWNGSSGGYGNGHMRGRQGNSQDQIRGNGQVDQRQAGNYDRWSRGFEGQGEMNGFGPGH